MVPAQQQPVLQPQPDYMQTAGSGAQFPTLETVDLSGHTHSKRHGNLVSTSHF
jgi:hypothetical protein